MRSEIPATFAGIPAIVINLSAEGIALRHESTIKVNSSGSIRIESEENTSGVSFRGRVRWSHMSRTATAAGKLQYDSGIEIEEVTDAVGGLLGRLIRAFGEKDTESMQRKQEAALKRVQDSSTPQAPPATPSPAPTITKDQILLIREANLKLESSPDVAQEWYDRAKETFAKQEDRATPSLYRREVIAVWQYLGGKIDLEVITAVLDAENA